MYQTITERAGATLPTRTELISTPAATTRAERYLEAERRLWQHYGLEPDERFLDLEAPAARLRVLEIGSGEPVLFVHGTVGPGGWASLISELPGFRSIVLDRPGWGLSSAIDFSGQSYKTLVADVLRGVLDSLQLRRAHIVGGSIGNVWALRLAAQDPSRVRRVALLGGVRGLDPGRRRSRPLAVPLGSADEAS